MGGIGNICAEPFSLTLMGFANASQCLVMALYGHKIKDFLEKVLHVVFLNVDACPLYNQFTCFDTALELWSCWICALILVLFLYCFASQDVALDLWNCSICALIWALLCSSFLFYFYNSMIGERNPINECLHCKHQEMWIEFQSFVYYICFANLVNKNWLSYCAWLVYV